MTLSPLEADICLLLLLSDNFGEGQIYDDDDLELMDDPDFDNLGDDTAEGGNKVNGSSNHPNNNNNVVVGGDPAAAAAAAARAKNTVQALKDKKIPKDQRTTTPYMTKYERARVIGTRALQIRFVDDGPYHVC